jgi:hypothetical protein
MSVSFNKHHEHGHPVTLSYARRGGGIPAGLLRPQNPLLKSCTVPTALHLVLQTAQPQVWDLGVWLDAVLLHVSVYQKRARIVRAKRVRTRPFVASPRPCDPPLALVAKIRWKHDEMSAVKACLGV